LWRSEGSPPEKPGRRCGKLEAERDGRRKREEEFGRRENSQVNPDPDTLLFPTPP